MNIAMETEPVVSLTIAAAGQIQHFQNQDPANAGKFLRVYVEDGGCSGMQYGMVYDEKRDGDLRVEFHGATVLVDSFSANYLRGSQIDYVDGLTGGGFKITNPNARQSCGCGKSFEA